MQTTKQEFQDNLATVYACAVILRRNRHMDPEMKQAIDKARKYFNTHNAVELAKVIGDHYE